MSDNTASNLGTGQGIFAQKVGDDLQFKSLIGGTNVSLTADANNITITASNDTTALNLGTGAGLFTSKSGDNLQLKSIIANAASGISVTSNANDLTFQLVTANVDAGKLGGVAASDFLQKSNNLSGLTSVPTARTNLSVYSKAEIDGFTVKNNANVLPDTDSTYSLGSNSYKWLNIYADNFYGTATQAGSISALNSIGNVNAGSPNNNDIIKYNSTGSVWETGTLSLLNLSDTPANYTSAANKFLRVNPAGNGVEFVTGVATESFVTTQITNLVGGAPGALDTLNELADALNDDAAFSTTITNSLAGKENTVAAGTTAQYYRGDKSFQTLDTDVVPEGSSNKYLTAGNMGTISIDALSDVRTTGSNSPSDAQALVWDNIGGYWKPGTVSGGGGGGSGDIEGVVAGTGLTGGGSTGTVTLNVDVGTTASKIVQLNGSAQLPAVSGALLTNINTDNLTEGSSNLFYTDTRFDNRLATKSTTNLTEGTNLYYTDARVNARVNALGKANWDTAYGWGDHSAAGYQTTAGLNGAIDTHLNQSNPTSGYVLSWNGSDYAWVANGSGGGDITAVVAGTGLTGGATSGSATLNVDVGTTANKIVQLDGSARLPAVDGSALTNLPAKTFASLTGKPTTIAGYGITDAFSGAYADLTGKPTLFDNTAFDTRLSAKTTDDLTEGSSNLYFTNARADARIAAAGINALSDVDTTGIANDKILKYNSSSGKWEMADDQTGGGGSATFTGLSDTPANFSGAASRFVKVNAGSNALEFVADPGYLTSETFTSLVQDTTPQLGGTLDANSNSIDMGTNVLTDTNLGQFITAYGWGNHASAGYLTSIAADSIDDTMIDFGTGANQVSTADIPEQTNLYYTDARSYTAFDTRLATKDTDDLSEGTTNLYHTTARVNSAFDTRLAGKSTTDLTEGSNLYFTNARADARADVRIAASSIDALSDVDTSGISSGQVLSWNGSSFVASNAGSGDITAVVAGTGLTGGATTGSATLNVDVGTTANKILQLDGSAKIPAVDGSLLTNISFTPGADSISDTMIDFGTGGGQVNTADIPEVTNLYFTNARADARIGAASINALSDVNTSGVSSGQVLKWSGSAWVPGADTSPADTDALSEGSSNLYFTNARVDSHLNQSNPTSGYVLSWNGSDYAWVDNGAATPGGSDTQVQFNDSGSFAGDSGFTYNKTTDTLTVGSVTTTGASPNVSAAGNLGITTTASNGNITITPHNTGDIILDGQKWPQADGSANQYLKTNGAGQLSWDSLTTDDVAEGSNEYFTNAKAVSAVQAVNLNMGSNNITTTGKILFSNVYSAEGDLPNASTYHGMFAHVHATGAGYFAHGGNWIKLANNSQLANSSNWDTAYGWGNHASAGYLTSIAADSIDDTMIDFGTGANQVSTADIPEATNLYYTNARADARIAAAGLTTLSDVDAVVAGDDGKVLYYDHSSTSFKWKTDATGGGTLNTAGNTGTGSVALASETLTVTGTTGQINVDAAAFALSLSLDPNINSITSIAFEGSTADTNETKLQAVDPTADNTINLPDASGHLAVFATASPAAITDGTAGQALVTNGSGQLSFADAGGGTDIQRFKINYATTGQLSSISDKTSGISSVSIDSAAGGDITINFTGYSYPPGSITLYGYNYAANKYNVTPLNKDITLREIPGGGSSGSPTAFGSFSSMKIRAAESDTGASRSFGTVTHAWVHVVMGG